MRMYHVIAINERSGSKTYCASAPVTHDEGCIVLKKLSCHPVRRVQLEEAEATGRSDTARTEPREGAL